ncbi:MAG TPA: hypothetical protein VK021_07895 [Flavobacteriaceae bacterium]|nr:hypothetical protein [Flavobacteriaceae bacterium]
MKFSNIFVLAFIFILASTTITYAQSTQEEVQIEETSKTITTKVKGITCSDDLKTISANVEKMKGVSACEAGKTGPTTTFKIVYNPDLVTEQEIHAVIQDTEGCKNPNDRPYKVKL